MKIYELILYWRESKMSRETDVVGYVQSRLLRFRSMDPRQCRFAPVASLKTFFELSYKHRCRYAPDAFAHACRSALRLQTHTKWIHAVETSGFNSYSLKILNIRIEAIFVASVRPFIWITPALMPLSEDLHIDVVQTPFMSSFFSWIPWRPCYSKRCPLPSPGYRQWP